IADQLTSSMSRLNTSGDSRGGAAERTSSGENSGSGSGGPPQRKADLAYNHLQLAERPGICKASRAKMTVITNYFRLNAPSMLKFVSFRVEFFIESSRRRGDFEPVKKEKMSECFKKVWQEHRNIFPRKDAALVYNGTDMIYCPPDHKITRNEVQFQNNAGATFRGRPARPQVGKMTITPIGYGEIPTVRVEDEADRCALMQFLDCILTQEHRFDLTGRAARFVQHGHSLFKIPRTPQEQRLDVVPIGKGEEVWLGLHAAVKCDANELMLNADTSGSIFKTRNMNLIDFFAQVVKGYNNDLSNINGDNITIDKRNLDELEKVIKGTKLLLKHPNGSEKLKKFERFSRYSADREFFNLEGRDISIAEFFNYQYQWKLKFPRFPCLSFQNKQNKSWSLIPMEFFYTVDEPTRFKGKLTDQQLDIFVKAVCQNPRNKKDRIERFCVAGGEYLGESAVMREWGVSIDRKMVAIEDCPVLPLPHIEMAGSAPQVSVDTETGEWKISETAPNGEEKAVHPIEKNNAVIVLAVIYLEGDQRQTDTKHANLLQATLRGYGLNVSSWNNNNNNNNNNINPSFPGGRRHRHIHWRSGQVSSHCANLEKQRNIKHIPLHVWVFPRRQAGSYAAIKYYSDVVYGAASQCTVRKTYEKLAGNCITNTSAQNLLLKILAKTGSIEFRLSSFAHKNIEKLQNPNEPTLILGVDVSHPGREERFDAIEKHEQETGMTAKQQNKFRGQHEKLPSARPVGKTLFKDLNYYDCPRSVVSVVGTTDIKGARYGVSSRVQRIGQEETVNMVEPFQERIREFYEQNNSKLPKHIIIYRDGASDTQVKKIAYEELESLERACESFDMRRGGENDYTITYIIVAKRHHTRFFRADLDKMPDTATHMNCPPGTLVEQTIVSRNKWDFYLQSHYGNLGTALPTRYTVVRDDWSVSPAFVQTVVFAHCFGNVRCPRPLSIPVPLHYAHLAAKRSKVLFDHYKENPSNEYINSTEDLVRETIEMNAITPHKNIKEMKGMHYA
ncbi:hypothetical protein PMAYCL1PPCAC_26926, partial [Pristionchus mayeri]